MPPVEQSYWTGFLALGLLSIATCVIPTQGVAPSFVGPSFALIILLVWFSSCLIFLLPMSLIRLGLHRKNIARAIQQRTYPGGQRFGFAYLAWSLVLSMLSFLGGGFLFFGVCTGLVLMSEGGELPVASEWLFFPLLILDGIISLLATGFLLNLGVPKYRS